MGRKMALMDWRAMKYYHVRGVLIPIFVTVIGMFSSMLLIIPTSVLMFAFFSLNPFAVEEKGALNNLYLTLPVSRDDIVAGRFILTGIMAAGGVLISIPIMFLVNRIGWSHYYIPFSWYVFIVALSYLMFSVSNLATFPILFKLGYSKGKFWGLALPAIFMGMLYGIFTVIVNDSGNMVLSILQYAYENILLISGGIILLSTALLVISFRLSKHIYLKRDF